MTLATLEPSLNLFTATLSMCIGLTVTNIIIDENNRLQATLSDGSIHDVGSIDDMKDIQMILQKIMAMFKPITQEELDIILI
ncbi:MAG: hypothetical protein RR398_00840 [Clostridia bacterium]